MPAYEYKCEDCESTFTVIATMAEKSKGLTVTCRMCGSESVHQIYSGISLMTGRSGNGSGSGGGCTPGGSCCG
jgi:putative FmdB family regulatory protein